ncbi:MAG: MarC family protein [Coprothermobacterota bacterium]|nr:MarC family protein [Coprothermobacterota bacterium]
MKAVELLTYAITVFVMLFTVVDPIGLLPVLMGLTGPLSHKERGRIVSKAVLVAASVMAFFALFGKFILLYFGISLGAFYIAGGILLFLISIDMIFARPSRARETRKEEEEGKRHLEEIYVFPLAIPMLSGPGTIATVMLLKSLAEGDPLRLLIFALSTVLVLVASWAILRAGAFILGRIGQTGVLVISRLMGILLSALAVQFVVDGIKSLF